MKNGVMRTILLPEPIIQEGLALLEGKAHVIVAPNPTEEAIIESAPDAWGIVLRSRARITSRVLAALPNLRIISRTGVGVDNIDMEAANQHQVIVCNLPDVNTATVAEHVIALLFALMKQLPLMDSYVRDGKWSKRSECPAMDVEGKVLGLVGLGRIGSAVMRKCLGLGLSVLVYDPFVQVGPAESVRFVEDPAELFRSADVVSVHVPLVPETRGLITGELLNLMKPDAFFINTSRGQVVDEKALIHVLETKRIAGAGLDVFANEPIDPDNPLLRLDNVILTPHTAALTRECRVRMTVEAVQQVVDFLEGKLPPHIVNRKELRL